MNIRIPSIVVVAALITAAAGLLSTSAIYGRPPVGFARSGPYHDGPGFIRGPGHYEPEYRGPALRIVARPRHFLIAPPRGHIVVSIGGSTYYQYGHVYYRRVYLDDRWVYVEAVPVGMTVVSLPESPDRVVVNGQAYYRNGSTFYVEKPQATIAPDGTTVLAPSQFTTVRPPVGAMIDSLPEGTAVETKGSTTYYRSDDTYYLPVKVGQGEKFVVVAEPK